MDELQKQIGKVVNDIVQNMMDQVKKARDDKVPLDLSEFVKALSTSQEKLNQYFLEARQRQKKGSKFFG